MRTVNSTPRPTDRRPDGESIRPGTLQLLRAGALAGVIAAVCTTAVASIARAADVGVEVDGEPIPVAAFAWWTLVGAAIGVVVARLLRRRRRFVVVTTVATGLSLIPAFAAADGTAGTAVLVAAHLLAAAIIIPALRRQLPADRGLTPTTA